MEATHRKRLALGLRVALALSALAAGPVLLSAQENPCQRRTLPVSVVDKNGNLVEGLTAADFRGEFRGKPVQILSVEPDQRHRRLVILVDASGSVISAPTWPMVCNISADAYRHFLDRSSMAFLVFSGTILKKVGFNSPTEDQAKLVAHLDLERETRRGEIRKTALWGALQAAIDELRPADLGDVIYVITDAGNNVYKTKPSNLRRELAESGIRLFALVIWKSGLPRIRTPDEANGSQRLLEMVRDSGGNALFLSSADPGYSDRSWSDPRDRAATLATIGQLYRQMDYLYRVEIRPEMLVDRQRNWKLEVVGKDGKPRRDVEIHYPQSLLPCRDAAP
jgi:hypothetical protein